MKDSKEKENRISNLKNMFIKMKKVDIDESDEENFEIEDISKLDNVELEEDHELINYLYEEQEEEVLPEIDDEFIYNPAKDNSEPTILEEENEIDENFIIKTALNDEKNLDDEDSFEEIEENDNKYESTYDADYIISKQFDSLIDIKIGKYKIIHIIGVIVGVILISLSIFISSNGSERIIDNVVSGEVGVIVVLLIFFGLSISIFSIFKLFSLKNPFEKLALSINNLENSKKTKTNFNKTEEKIGIPKSKIPIDKEAYKIGEFDISSFKENLKKPTSKLDGVKYHKTETAYKNKSTESKPNNVSKTGEKPVEKELLPIEEDKVDENIDSRSIDDIFASIEEIEDMSILSIDEKVEKNSSKKEE